MERIGFWDGARWKFHLNLFMCFAAEEEMEAAAPDPGVCEEGSGKWEINPPSHSSLGGFTAPSLPQ